MPRTPFRGVRISWLMLARKSVLARLANSACSFAAFSARRDSTSAVMSVPGPAVAHEAAAGVVDRLAVQLPVMALAAAVDVFVAEVLEGPPGVQVFEVRPDIRRFGVLDQLAPGPAQERRGLKAGDLAPALRDVGDAQLLVHLPEPIRGDVGEVAEALLALAQRLLGAPPLGDVLDDAQHRRDPALLVQLAEALGRDLADLAVRPQQAQLETKALLGGEGLLQVLLDLVAVFGVVGLQRPFHRRSKAVGFHAVDAVDLIRPVEMAAPDRQAPMADVRRLFRQGVETEAFLQGKVDRILTGSLLCHLAYLRTAPEDWPEL